MDSTPTEASTKRETSPDEKALKSLTELRDAHFRSHPLIVANAKLPVPMAHFMIDVVERIGGMQRRSVGLCAPSIYGKTSALRLLMAELAEMFPGCGIFYFEPRPLKKRKTGQEKEEIAATALERRLLEDIVLALGIEGGLFRSAARMRQVIVGELIARSLPARHLFLIFDEAQGFREADLLSLKPIVNALIAAGIRLCTVCVGQMELLELRNSLRRDWESDLEARFMEQVYVLPGISTREHMTQMLEAADDASEFPAGSGYTYTQLLLPRAFAGGFRLASLARGLLNAFVKSSAIRSDEPGIAAQYVAEALSELFRTLKDRDVKGLVVRKSDLAAAVAATGYSTRKPLKDFSAVQAAR